jgi:hypothetical protein
MTVTVNKKIGECECCPKTDIEITLHYGNLWMCDECWEKDNKLTAESMKPENVAARVEAVNKPGMIAIEAAKIIDNSIQVRTDIFNAATESIINIKKAIDEDASITNKPYALAETLKNRFEHFKTVIFEAQETIVQAGNEQKAIQTYLNTLANKLHAEEREKLKIADINYRPQVVKPVKPAAIKTSGTKAKFNKAELQKFATELGVSAFTLQMICTQKGITPEQAANILRKSINEAKSESPAS